MDSTGAKIWEATYLPFGGVHVVTGDPINLRFPGQWFQLESGLHQNWMRDYDATLGRYIQADPLGLIDGASVYGYALQNPGKNVDPRGEFAIPFIPWIWGIITGGGVTTTIGVSTTGIGAAAGITVGIGVAVTPSSLGNGTSGPTSPPLPLPIIGNSCGDDTDCDAEEAVREAICRIIPNAARRSRCWERSALIGGQCRAGKPQSPFPYP